MKLYTGYDARESIGWHTFTESVLHNCSVPVQIIPMTGKQRDGSNAFTYERFLTPYYNNYEGWAIFMDGADMVCLGDIADLEGFMEPSYAVRVVKHEYKTRNPVKYLGTDIQSKNVDYPRKNWSSVCLWNCAHPANRILTPQLIADADGRWLHGFSWLADDLIGDLPSEWNRLVDEGHTGLQAKLLHWTAGIPAFAHYRNAPFARVWMDYMLRANRGWQAEERKETA